MGGSRRARKRREGEETRRARKRREERRTREPCVYLTVNKASVNKQAHP